MRVSDKVIHMIKHHEGVRTKPYQCPALLWTVGVGHVIDPMHGRLKLEERRNLPIPDGWNRTLSMEEVDDILKKDLARFEQGVARLCPGPLTQGQFDALVSFSFNVGLGNLQKSTIRMKVNRQDFEGAAEAFLDWTKAGGKVLKGLVNRRNDERALFLS
jgi:lysozyme